MERITDNKRIANNTLYFCRDMTERLKGWLSMGVFASHFFQLTGLSDVDSILGIFLRSLGGYCVSLFFFISGYGLMASFRRNGGGKYLHNYQRNRVLPIFFINALLVIIYAVQKSLFGSEVTATNLILSFFYGGNVVTYGWYLLCIMVLYELFYVSARFCRSHVCSAVTVTTLLYIVLAMAIKMPGWWYMSCLAFPCGALFWHCKGWIDATFRGCRALFLLLALLLYLGSFAFLYVAGGEHSVLSFIPCFLLIRHCMAMAHGVFLVLVVVGVLMMVGSPSHAPSVVTKKLSAIYLEIYVMQGLAFAVLHNSWWSLDNDCLFAVFSLLLTLALATAIRPVFRKIVSWVRV